jgi:hypothetical protein
VPVQPAIYVQYLVTREGVALDAQQRDVLVRCLRTYITDADYAFKIDHRKDGGKTNKTQCVQGRRRYLSRSPDEAPIEGRKRHVLQFATALEGHTRANTRCELIPLREVGFSSRAIRRLQEHRCHYNSKFLMNLIDVIYDLEFDGIFHLDQYVVACLFAAPQASVAEILITRLD